MTEQNDQPFSAQTAIPLADAPHSAAHDDLLHAASDPALSGDQALALLARPDLAGEVIEQLAKNRSVLKLRKVKIALACHPHAPRHISVPLIRQFYTFDLMKVALSLVVPAELKLNADQTLIARLKTITLGECLTLARRASGRVAGALLLDREGRIMRVALENARLTEAQVVQAILSSGANAALVYAVSQHEKWSCRRDIQLALLRTEHLSLARALAFTHEMSEAQLNEILKTSRLPEKIKNQLLKESAGRNAQLEK
jgi:hypothetical protein